MFGLHAPSPIHGYVEDKRELISHAINRIGYELGKKRVISSSDPRIQNVKDRYIGILLDALSLHHTVYEKWDYLLESYTINDCKNLLRYGHLPNWLGLKVNECLVWVNRKEWVKRKASGPGPYKEKMQEWVRNIGSTMASDMEVYSVLSEDERENIDPREAVFFMGWYCMIMGIVYDFPATCIESFKEIYDKVEPNYIDDDDLSGWGRDFLDIYKNYWRYYRGNMSTESKVHLDVSVFF